MLKSTNTSNDVIRIVQPRQGIWRTYDGTDGLPPGHYFCLLQDRQGYLWLGAEKGLCRYDGVRFITYTTKDGLPANCVTSICEDSQGCLWVGTDGGVSCYDGERFTNYSAEDGLVGIMITSICEDSHGRLWFGSNGGVSCYDGERFINYSTEDGLAGKNVQAICEDSQKCLWFGTNGGVSCYDGERFINYTTEDGLAGKNVQAICEDSQKRLWFGTNGGVSYYDGEIFINYATQNGLAGKNVQAICEDNQERLWFSIRDGGVCCFDGRIFTTYTTADGLLDNRVWDILQDHEGSFWLVHIHSGLTRFDPETARLLTGTTVSEALIQTRDGALWFGEGNHLYCLHKGKQRCQNFDSVVNCLMEDSNGRFWIGTYDGLYCYDSAHSVCEEKPKHFTEREGLKSNTIFSVIESRDGTIWVGTGGFPGYLCRFGGSRFEAIQTPNVVVQRLLEDNYGRIWMGGWVGGGLSCYDPAESHGVPLQNYTTKHGLPSNNVVSIVEDDANRLWIGTRNGLCCFDGNQFIPYSEEIPEHSNHQFSVRDVNGQLWFGTQGNGVYRYDGRHFQQLSKADGLPNNTITGLIPQQDGSMIIGTYSGIVHYRPTAIVPPRIEIREVVADQMYSHPSDLELNTTGADLVIIAYHGLSLSTRRMRYSYILEGYDKEWLNTWESQARYEKLPTGEYTFRIMAVNRDLIPSETPAELKLRIVPDPRDVKIDAMQTEIDLLRREAGSKYDFGDIIGNSVAIRQVRALMESAIDSSLNVLITGETGTGKELVAKAIHYNSPRKSGPLIDYNCTTATKELINDHLFGHRKGAFTDAKDDRIGLFEAASGGTLLLDEIGDMPYEVQGHLLRTLAENKVHRLGEEHIARNVDVRIIAMTNRDLVKEVKEGRFREDLFFRLSVFPIHVPPLRERLEDIPLLAEHFLEQYSGDMGKELVGFVPGVMELLQSYNWPGNVRDLQNAIRRAIALTDNGKQIGITSFALGINREESLMQEILPQTGGYRELVDRFRQKLIENTLQDCDGNRSEAARRLGMDRSNLGALIKHLGIKS